MSWKVGDLVEYTDTQDRIRYAIIERFESGYIGDLRVRTLGSDGVISAWSHLFTADGIRIPRSVPDKVSASYVAWLITGGRI